MPPRFERVFEIVLILACALFIFNTLSDYAHGEIDFAPCMACENGG